jgi:hypothetical protein
MYKIEPCDKYSAHGQHCFFGDADVCSMCPWYHGIGESKLDIAVFDKYSPANMNKVMMMTMVFICLSKRTPLLNGLGFSGTS